MLTLIAPLKAVAVFPNSSWAATTTGGAMAAPVVASLGCPVNANLDAAPGPTVTVAA
jgi:hypothetical protein